jgi:hypothetical protein
MSGDEKSIAEATFGLHDFDDMFVYERLEKLEEREGIKTYTAKERRANVLGSIRKALVVLPDAPRTNETTSQNKRSLLGTNEYMMQRVANLHYSILVSYFVVDKGTQLREAEGVDPAHFDARPRILAERTLECYVDFIAACDNSPMLGSSERFEQQYGRTSGPSFHAEGRYFVGELVKEIYSHDPFDNTSRKLLKGYGHKLWSPLTMSGQSDIRELYNDVWLPWYIKSLDDRHNRPASGLWTLGALAITVTTDLARYIGYQSGPALATARRLAHKALAYYFDFDEYAPIMDGISLRDRADAYFDRISFELVKDYQK